jgi:hypothetical protein
MTVEQLRIAHRLRPFQTFTIHMADGLEFYIPHPDFLSFSPSGRRAIVFGEDDSWSVVDPLLMSDSS